MTTINTQNVKMFTQEVEQMLGQIGGASGDYSFVNSIFTSVEQFQSEDGSVKASGWQNLANGIMGLVEKIISLLSTNESAKASQDVKNNSKKADDSLKSIQESSDTIQAGLDEFNENVNMQTEIINGAKEEIEKDNEKLAKEQEAVQQILAQIEERKKELEAAQNDPNKNPAEILGVISELSGELQAHIDAINELKKDIENLSAISITALSAVEDTANIAKELQEREQSNTDANAADLKTTAGEVLQTEATGVVNETTSVETEALGDAASSNAFTMSAAPKLFQVASDQGTAGVTRISGAASALPQLQVGIGGLLNNTTLLGAFANAVGSSTNDFSNLVGGFNTILESAITSVGSFANVETIKENLDNAVKEDNELLKAGDKNPGLAMDSSDASKEHEMEGPLADKENGINPELRQLYKFKTPDVDLKLETA